jgi:transcriptional regulator with XRE-family HTH domain
MSAPVRRPSKTHWPRLYDELRSNLVRAREAAGLTQRQAASKMGRAQSFIAKSESGERRVDAIELIQFASAYGVAVSTLLPVVKR